MAITEHQLQVLDQFSFTVYEWLINIGFYTIIALALYTAYELAKVLRENATK